MVPTLNSGILLCAAAVSSAVEPVSYRQQSVSEKV